MSYYPKSQYSFVRFTKSNRPFKKYSAILQNKSTKQFSKVHFGDTRYQQYKDTTGLGLFTHKNHLDIDRRKNYRARHRGHLKPGNYSAGYFSYKYLW